MKDGGPSRNRCMVIVFEYSNVTVSMLVVTPI